jgi:hypothetical protein
VPIAQPLDGTPAVGEKEDEREGQRKRSNAAVQEHEIDDGRRSTTEAE